MAWFIRREVVWLAQHAELKKKLETDERAQWWCKTTGAAIMAVDQGRSIWHDMFRGAGSGEVRTITHLYCSGCNPDYSPPSLGMPIYDSEIGEGEGV